MRAIAWKEGNYRTPGEGSRLAQERRHERVPPTMLGLDTGGLEWRSPVAIRPDKLVNLTTLICLPAVPTDM